MPCTASIPQSLHVPLLLQWKAGASPAIVRWSEETNVRRWQSIQTSRSPEAGGPDGVPESNGLLLKQIDGTIRATCTCPLPGEAGQTGEAEDSGETGSADRVPESDGLILKQFADSIRTASARPVPDEVGKAGGARETGGPDRVPESIGLIFKQFTDSIRAVSSPETGEMDKERGAGEAGGPDGCPNQMACFSSSSPIRFGQFHHPKRARFLCSQTLNEAELRA